MSLGVTSYSWSSYLLYWRAKKGARKEVLLFWSIPVLKGEEEDNEAAIASSHLVKQANLSLTLDRRWLFSSLSRFQGKSMDVDNDMHWLSLQDEEQRESPLLDSESKSIQHSKETISSTWWFVSNNQIAVSSRRFAARKMISSSCHPHRMTFLWIPLESELIQWSKSIMNSSLDNSTTSRQTLELILQICPLWTLFYRQ